jgi:thiamine-monophosphate kinase
LSLAGTPLGALGERALVRRLQARIPAGPGVRVGVGDDAAAVEVDPLALLTADSLVEGVHFRRETTPARLLGRKALSVNLSDVAAMGGVGRHAIVSLCLPPELELRWVDSLFDGLLERAAETGVNVVGGNVARSREAVIDVTLLGAVQTPLLRSGAQAGDVIVVTGALGAAAEGVSLLAQGARLDEDGELAATGVWTESSAPAVLECLRAQLDPRPPLALACALSERSLAHAGMDVSDGLSIDLAELCRQSGVGARVDAAAVPVAPAVASLERARGGDALSLALHGGEDYELLLAVDPLRYAELEELAGVWGVPVCEVGGFFAGEPLVVIRDGAGERALEPGGYDHFRAAGTEGRRR